MRLGANHKAFCTCSHLSLPHGFQEDEPGLIPLVGLLTETALTIEDLPPALSYWGVQENKSLGKYKSAT